MMTCSSCGKMIPEAGQICPFCRADKTADLKAMAEIRTAPSNWSSSAAWKAATSTP